MEFWNFVCDFHVIPQVDHNIGGQPRTPPAGGIAVPKFPNWDKFQYHLQLDLECLFGMQVMYINQNWFLWSTYPNPPQLSQHVAEGHRHPLNPLKLE